MSLSKFARASSEDEAFEMVLRESRMRKAHRKLEFIEQRFRARISSASADCSSEDDRQDTKIIAKVMINFIGGQTNVMR